MTDFRRAAQLKYEILLREPDYRTVVDFLPLISNDSQEEVLSAMVGALCDAGYGVWLRDYLRDNDPTQEELELSRRELDEDRDYLYRITTKEV